jgi:Fe2+ transport system protein FeoA
MGLRELAYRSDVVRPLSALPRGAAGVVVRLRDEDPARAGRLIALGVTRGARVRVLQTFPGIVFMCDETELVVERGIASQIYVDVDDNSLPA